MSNEKINNFHKLLILIKPLNINLKKLLFLDATYLIEDDDGSETEMSKEEILFYSQDGSLDTEDFDSIIIHHNHNLIKILKKLVAENIKNNS